MTEAEYLAKQEGITVEEWYSIHRYDDHAPSKFEITLSDFANLFSSPEEKYQYEQERERAVEANAAARAGMSVEEYRASKAASADKAAKKAADARAKIAAAAAAEKTAAAEPADIPGTAPERPRKGFAGVVQFPRGRASSLEAASSMSPLYIAAIAVVVAGGAYYLFKGKR